MAEYNSNQAQSKRSHWKTLGTLAKYLWPKNRADLRIRVLIAFLCLVLAKLINVYVPFLYKGAIDALTPSKDQIALILPLGLILAYGSARILSQVFGQLRDFVFVRVARHAQRTVALNTFQHLHALSLSFHLNRQTGGLSRVIERGTRGIDFTLTFMTFNIVPTILEIAIVTGVLIYHFDFIFAAITFLTIFVYIAFTLVVTEWRLRHRKAMNKNDSEANTKAIDSLLNYETVKYFGNESHEYRRFDKALAGYEAAAIKNQGSLSLLNVGQGVIVGVGLVLVMVLAGKGVVENSLTLGDFVLINTFLIQLYLPLDFLGFVYREIKQSLIDMDKMFELIEVNAEVKDTSNAKPLSLKKRDLEFREVSFGYHPDRNILKNISFHLEEGETVAIVGPSGSGKSTISRLLFRFFDTKEGSIYIGGQNIREFTQNSLRAAIGVVPQDTVLFNDTIEYNIRYGRPEAPSEEIVEAAKLAQIHDFVMALPEKYETKVGERGLKLSGGEKQRVAIARTILKDPQILMFDEATSALDSHTEREIQNSLNQISKNRTTLVIAHRLSTIVDADLILVLGGGGIIERGNHSELLAKGGEYFSMWSRQQEVQECQERLDQALAQLSSVQKT